MNIRDVEKTTVVDIAGKAISQSELKNIEKLFIKKASTYRIAINLKNVEFITHEFIDFLRNCYETSKISLFGLNTDIYVMLFATHNDKFVDIYLDENDFCNDKNSIVNRRLKLLKTA